MPLFINKVWERTMFSCAYAKFGFFLNMFTDINIINSIQFDLIHMMFVVTWYIKPRNMSSSYIM